MRVPAIEIEGIAAGSMLRIKLRGSDSSGIVTTESEPGAVATGRERNWRFEELPSDLATSSSVWPVAPAPGSDFVSNRSKAPVKVPEYATEGTRNAQTGFAARHSAISFVAAALILLCLGVASVFAQQPSPTPLASPELAVPPIAPDFHPAQRPLPELSRVGVDLDRQKPLSLREALALALENNKDIEVARHNVKIAEFDLLGAHGAYDPKLSSSAYYERIKNPISSFLAGGANGATTSSDYTGTMRMEGQTPKFGGNYRLDFSSIRQTTNNQFVPLSPQYPTALTFNYTQPLFRGLRFDNNRRQIEIAKRTWP